MSDNSNIVITYGLFLFYLYLFLLPFSYLVYFPGMLLIWMLDIIHEK